MYNKENSVIKSQRVDLTKLIDGSDLYNSKFLYLLKTLDSSTTLTISTEVYRIDLISDSIYDDSSYAELLLLYNGLRISELLEGVVISAPSISDITSLMTSLSTKETNN